MKGDLEGILRARELSRATLRNIRQNLFFAFVYNSLAVPLAAGALYPRFGILLSPMIGVRGDELKLRFRHRQCPTSSRRLRLGAGEGLQMAERL